MSAKLVLSVQTLFQIAIVTYSGILLMASPEFDWYKSSHGS